MITILFLNGRGDIMPIGQAASSLGVSVRELKNYLIDWENHQWPEGYRISRHTCTFIFSQPDQWDIGSIRKEDRKQNQLILLKFSMELTL